MYVVVPSRVHHLGYLLPVSQQQGSPSRYITWDASRVHQLGAFCQLATEKGHHILYEADVKDVISFIQDNVRARAA